MYLGGRFLLGFGNSLSQMASPLLLTEICHPQHRGPVTAIYNCLWNLGALCRSRAPRTVPSGPPQAPVHLTDAVLVVSSIGWGTSFIPTEWSWRSITFLQIVPSVTQLLFIWWIPESPRYLVNKDKHEEALGILAKWHAGGDVRNATVQFEFHEIKETIRIEKEVDRATSYLDFFRTKGNRWRLAIIISLGVISQYSGNAVFSNYMNTVYEGAGITDQNQKLGMSTGKTIFDLIITVSAALNVDRFGRRPLFLISTAGMVVMCACWTLTGAIYYNSGETNIPAGYTQLVFIWLFGAFYDIGFSGLLVAYALEVLPFHLRAKGMMLMNITVQATLALGKCVPAPSFLCPPTDGTPGSQTNKIAWDNLPSHWYFMLFYTLWDVLEFGFVWFVYPETKGPTLEEIAKIFDGHDAVAHVDLERIEKEMRNTSMDDDRYIAAAQATPRRSFGDKYAV